MISAHVQRLIDQQLTELHNVPLAWYDVLTVVRDAGGTIRVRELCRELDEVPSSLSRRLDRMEDDDLIERRKVPRPDDRRAVEVAMTTEGRYAWRDANITYRRLVQHHFASSLTDTDIAALQRLWTKLQRNDPPPATDDW
ncbi:MAG: MarR family winged helix-turn-helix transcriptional regulator [Ilumatobacteraceae bacterium]